jgi:hypothetical protein
MGRNQVDVSLGLWTPSQVPAPPHGTYESAFPMICLSFIFLGLSAPSIRINASMRGHSWQDLPKLWQEKVPKNSEEGNLGILITLQSSQEYLPRDQTVVEVVP